MNTRTKQRDQKWALASPLIGSEEKVRSYVYPRFHGGCQHGLYVVSRAAQVKRTTPKEAQEKDTVIHSVKSAIHIDDIPDDSKHLAMLRLLTGRLEGMSFSEVSTVVGIDGSDLRAVLHGKSQLESATYNRIQRLSIMTRRLRTIVRHRAIGWWYRTSDPELNGKSPLELLKKNRIAELERLVESYFIIQYG